MNRNVFYVLALVLTSPLMMMAQSAPTGYRRITCLKAQPGKQAELAQFQNDIWKKVVQREVDEGEASAAYLLRTVFPGGEEAYCDYITVIAYAGIPPSPPGPEHLAGLLKKAGLDISVDAYHAKVRELVHVVASELWQPLVILGTAQKGDFLYLNFMKVHDMRTYLGFEQNVWKQMAEDFIKQGIMRGWFLMVPVFPSGTAGYQAVSVDGFPSWGHAVEGIHPVEADTFKRVHPDLQLSDFEGKLVKARDLDHRYLVTVEERIVPSSAQR